MKPYTNRLLIEPIKSDAVLITAESKYQQVGIVKAVGWRPWYHFWRPRFCRVGDKVAFNVWGADRAEIDGVEHWFILEHPDFLLAKL